MAEKLTDGKSQKKVRDVYQIDPGYQEMNASSSQYGVDYRFLTDHMADIV